MKGAKEALNRVMAWVKKNPYLAAGIGVALGVVVYFATRGSGSGDPETYTQGLGSSDESAASPLDALAGSSSGGLGGSVGSTSEATPAVSTPISATPAAPAMDFFSDPGLGSFESMGFTSDGGAGAFAAAMPDILPAASMAGSAAGFKPAPPRRDTPAAQAGVKPGAVITRPNATQTPALQPAPVRQNTPAAQAGVRPGAVINRPTTNRPSTITGASAGGGSSASLTIYTGPRPGYTWNASLKRYIRNTATPTRGPI